MAPDSAEMVEREVENPDGSTVRVSAPADEWHEPDPDERAEIARWWQRTALTKAQEAQVKQYEQDQEDILLPDDQADESRVSVLHIYRNSLQTVAMMVPERHKVDWSPRDEVDLVTGDELPADDPLAMELRRHDLERKGFAETLGVLVRNLGKKARFQDKLEAWVQDGCHFQLSTLVPMWDPGPQDDREEDGRVVTTEQTPDGRGMFRRIGRLAKDLARGVFGSGTAEMGEFRRSTDSLAGKWVIPEAYGPILELVPIGQCGWDPSVVAPEQVDAGHWWWRDIFLSDEELIEQFGVERNELQSAAGFELRDGQARQMWESGVSPGCYLSPDGFYYESRGGKLINHLRRVREVYDCDLGERLVICEGVARYLVREDLHQYHRARPPVVDLVMNRVHGRVAGLSHTQLQAKIQRRINQKRTDADEAREDSKPVYIYDKSVLTDEKDIKRIIEADPRSFVGVDARGEDLRKAIIPLASNHQFSRDEYDHSDDELELRKASALPEQATGITGNADFAKEVEVAAMAAGIQTRYLQARIKRALARVYDIVGNYVWNQVGVEQAVAIGGPLAARYWPDDPERRRQLYDELAIEVDVDMDRDAAALQRVDKLAKILEAATAAGAIIDGEIFARLFVRLLGEEETWDDLLRADPSNLARRLAQSMQQHPEDVSAETKQLLMAIAAPIMQEMVMSGAVPGGGAPMGGDGASPDQGLGDPATTVQ
jgi:hypothetical protein